MKIATYEHAGRQHVGRVDTGAGTVVPFALDAAGRRHHDAPDALALIEQLAAGGALPPEGAPLPLAQVRLLAPIPRPRRNVFCVGLNYRSHAAELAAKGFNGAKTAEDLIPKAAVVFSKVPDSVIGPGEAIRIPAPFSTAIDYEAELAIVIGRAGRAIPRERALAHVFGYTIVNDVSARDLQKRHQQWLIAKSCDTFCPMGPWIVTADELDGRATSVRLWVNGELRQDSDTSDLVFGIEAIVEAISQTITLQPGDVIATGTPGGVGMAFDPPKWLVPGDAVRVEIGGIGVLENPVT